jgi:hypothetical protein
LIVLGLLASPARAADMMVPAGGTLNLMENVILTGGDTFTAGEAGGARCTIHGNGHGFVVPKDTAFTGSVIIRNCDVDGLGKVDAMKKLELEAFLLTISGNGKFIIEGSTFSKSSTTELKISEHVDVVFRGNHVLKDAIAPALTLLLDSPPLFWSTGETDGMKLIQGNLIEKGRLKFTSTSGWIVGGAMPGEGNVMIGTRVGIELENASLMEIRGNYSHTLIEGERWNQVKNLSINGGDGNTIEHNVFWGRNWLVEMSSGGELRYNLLIDAAERGWVLTWSDSGAKIHHNLAIATSKSQEGPTGGFVIEDARTMDRALTTEAYNNTLDLGGKCNPGVEGAVVLRDVSLLMSLRSNAFTNVRVAQGMGAALVRSQDPMQPPEHLGYADYNLFFTPDSPIKKSYSATVAGKNERTTDGFARNDVPAEGAIDQQVDPLFTGPIPRVFPFDEEMIKTRATTTCQVLAYYRKVYTPRMDSPVIDMGDLAEGMSNDVGAVGAGEENPADLFGRLCDETDVGTPSTAPEVFKCTDVVLTAPEPPGGGGDPGTGGMGPIGRPKGITCVCDVGAATPQPGAATLALLAALGLLAGRRRAGRRRGGR